MSLHTLASQLAAKGRNGDSMLLHVTPGEVAGLQALARKHGTSLTINPDTGLPEAFSLKSLLPTLLGAGLSFIPGMSPLMAAGLIGGGTTLASGSLQKGLMAGLGAYGGAGLGQGLAGMGTTAAASSAAAPAAQTAATSAAMPAAAAAPVETALASGAQPALSGMGEAAFASTPEMMAAPIGETVSQSFQGLAGSMQPTVQMPLAGAGLGPEFAQYEAGPFAQFMHQMGGGKGLAKYGLAALAPGMIAEPPEEQDSSGMIRPYTYDPTTQRYTALKPYKAPKYAEGGEVQHYFAGGGVGFNNIFSALSGLSSTMSGIGSGAGAGLGGDGGFFRGQTKPLSTGPATGTGFGASAPSTSSGFGLGGGSGGNGQMFDGPQGPGQWYFKPLHGPGMGFADGGGITGLLQGPGDGVSDSIPAMVNGQAPAALSNDEHVIPARVVSELGNGSSDAGHKRLDEMINRVNKRRAVTSRSRDAVGNDSGAHRMLPA